MMRVHDEDIYYGPTQRTERKLPLKITGVANDFPVVVRTIAEKGRLNMLLVLVVDLQPLVWAKA